MTAEFYLNNGFTIEELARELDLNMLDCESFISSGMDFGEWIKAVREVKYGVFHQFMMNLYDDLDND